MKSREPKLGKTLRDDWKNTHLKSSFKKDYSAAEDFFFTNNERARLKQMNSFNRLFFRLAWLLKKLFLKLTPFRRIILLIGTVLIIGSRNENENNLGILGGFIFLFLILLELKDKLIAKTELEEGRAIQISLMPERVPDIPGWEGWLYTSPANDVGGDLVDFQKLKENSYRISLGDISGKGLSAALLMAKLQASIRALVSEYSQMNKMVEKINTIFCNDTPRNTFASLLYFNISSDSGMIKYVNAGHLPPIIVKQNSVNELRKGQPALGLMKDFQYKEETLSLDRNDILISFSDGLTEAENINGEFYGKKRALELFATQRGKMASNIGENILSKVKNFIGEATPHDDISIVVLRKT
jgi:serine phosphatase RsbU (regulator of sigma subunit)